MYSWSRAYTYTFLFNRAHVRGSEMTTMELTANHLTMMDICRDLYEGSLEAMEKDLKERREAKPCYEKLAAKIDRDLKLIQEIRESGHAV